MKHITSFPGVPEFDPENKKEFLVVNEEFDGEKIDVIFRKGRPGLPMEEVEELRQKGEDVMMFSIAPHQNPRSYIATSVYPHITCRQDVPVKMRDGITIFADIYMPKDNTQPLPLLIAWGPFGKRPGEGQDEWKLMGVPPGTVSHMSKFESCDPAFWCNNGYAVANVDPRGAGHSEGLMHLWGTQDGQDGYDFIEWAAQQEWCNGRCALFGNSGVAMVQWRIAAEQPPHLACIAAWEGTGDMFRESYNFGGIPAPLFEESIVSVLASDTYIIDTTNMNIRYPHMNKFWEDMIPRWRDITVPAYIGAGLCHPQHLRGTLEGWRRIRSRKKWIRIHREFEWPDTYTPENLLDLKRFYDRYLKDIRNGWELTPKVRLDVMDAYDYDFRSRRVEKEFPLKRTEYRKLYLNADNLSLNNENPVAEAEREYDPEEDVLRFRYKFKEDTELIGYFMLHLNVEARGYDNMDMHFWIKKYNAEGEYVPVTTLDVPYPGTYGYCRTSRRELDEKYSTPFYPVPALKKYELMEEGKVYAVDISFNPHSRIWHKGEELVLEMAGHHMDGEFFPGFRPPFFDNEGTHVIHTGGQYESYLQIPYIPPKYKTGDYEYRG